MSRHRRAVLALDRELMVEVYAVCRSVNRSLDDLLRTSAARLSVLTEPADRAPVEARPSRARQATLADLHARCRELNISFSDLLAGEFRRTTDACASSQVTPGD